jgi:hypothetical protein
VARELEHRTVTTAFSSQNEWRGQLQAWSREGWAVISVSAPTPQEDGTIRREAKLSRARQ